MNEIDDVLVCHTQIDVTFNMRTDAILNTILIVEIQKGRVLKVHSSTFCGQDG